jgi:hypothetical protein
MMFNRLYIYKAHSPLAQECRRWPRIAISTLRSTDPYKASTGCIYDSVRENIVEHDQGARASLNPLSI